VTRAQLLASGVRSPRIDSWVHRGWLIAVHHGVYAVGYRRDDPPARAIAAVLACGPTALLSHESAAALWGWRRSPAVPEVTVTTDRRGRAIVVHWSRTITPPERDRQLGIPVTPPERTLRDIRRRLAGAQFPGARQSG